MKLKRLKIEGLFDLFDYDIPLDNEEGVTILTGPNGYGKTKILNIVNSFFNKKFNYFQKLIFTSIELTFDDGYSISITKKSKKSNEISFIVYQIEKEKEIYIFNDKKNEADLRKAVDKYTPLSQIDDDTWVNPRTDEFLTLEEAIEYLPNHESSKYNRVQKKEYPLLDQIINNTTTHLIKEQRLLERNSRFINHRSMRFHELPPDETIFTIHKYANTLKNLISDRLQDYFIRTQELDSSFPKRLLTEKNKIAEKEYKFRFQELRNKQEKLRRFGVSDVAQDVASFDEENAKVLLVYLNDAEQKIQVFDDLIERLELFTDILNERRFTYKYIKISKDKGFTFFTNKNQELNLTDLSSGEQNEVVLLYELIFNSKPDTLILIDEPEISLHVAWQKEFLNDLLKIIDLQKINVIMATHSPSIINNYWDLTYSLYQDKEEEIAV